MTVYSANIIILGLESARRARLGLGAARQTKRYRDALAYARTHSVTSELVELAAIEAVESSIWDFLAVIPVGRSGWGIVAEADDKDSFLAMIDDQFRDFALVCDDFGELAPSLVDHLLGDNKCNDCGRRIYWSETDHRYHHTDDSVSCFLIP